jgi:hypothetical protein
VAVEGQRATPTRARPAGDQLRPPGEVEARWDERPALERTGLPQVDLVADARKAVGEMLLQRRLLARRVADLARGRFEADQR